MTETAAAFGAKTREGRPVDAVDRARMRAEPLPEARVGALVEEVEVVGAEERGSRSAGVPARATGTGASFLRQKEPPSRQFTPEPGAADSSHKMRRDGWNRHRRLRRTVRDRQRQDRARAGARHRALRILAVIDAPTAGRDAGEVLDGARRGIPVFASIADALATPSP